MAEIKNTFLKSKMNKDLDDRIVPNGEYRDAVNVTISQSESGDVGAVENVRGNIEKLQIDTDITFIGSLADDVNNVIYIFIQCFFC